LAAGAVGRHLQRCGLRNRVGLVLETGEPREVNHFALLLSYGADAVNPYLAIETTVHLHAEGGLAEQFNRKDAIANYLGACNKGILKILSKMGISTLRSYAGAQVYEAIGLNCDFTEKYFTKTPTRIGGIGGREVAREALQRHQAAFGSRRGRIAALQSGGVYAWRRGGERRLWSPEAIFHLQQAARTGAEEAYRKFANLINDQNGRHVTLRSLFDFQTEKCTAIPLAEVEPVSELVKRFTTGAMSFGSLSREAHETMAVAMNRIGGMSNSGEGGEDPARYKIEPNGDSRSSAVKQVASGRFGVTIEYLVNAKELQIKIAQGAKPGEGGHLPGHKVNEEIARVRNSTSGVSLISPPPHHDIYSIEDLAQLIYDLKNANPQARVSVKLVSEAGVGTVAAGVAKGKADLVLISGGDGGTGASPLSSIKYAGVPWELGLAETQQTLVRNNLRGGIRVQTDGQIRTGRDVAIAALLGAEEFGFGTAALVCLGCVMMRKCHQNTCPVGVATQDPRLRKRFAGKPEHLINYLNFVAEELRAVMAALGFRRLDEMIGRSDLLKKREDVTHWKAKTLDFSALFHRPKAAAGFSVFCSGVKRDENGEGLDPLNRRILADVQPALERRERVDLTYDIRNVNRTVGAPLAFALTRKFGAVGLPDDSIALRFNGSAGQSFGAFAARGMSLILAGDANDYLGKGLSGGKIVVRAPQGTTYDTSQNVVVGNTLFYGATAGEAYIGGLAGERFCVRNSGARVVVEGVGDHGCEYMTGGVVAVLGATGVNFAAGMSGGVAYVYDPLQDFDLRCNLDMVDLEPITEAEDGSLLRAMIETHRRHTGSVLADRLLVSWAETRTLFVKVMPVEYRRALGRMAEVERNARRTEAEQVKQA
jgi:glutamate synthase domain-containing protein 2/glutamate synthase domain-containing protein 3